MGGTYTSTQTNTYTESRARYVLGKLRDDLISLNARGFRSISSERVNKWWEDICFVMHAKALEKVELQFRVPNGDEWALTYNVVSDGNIYRDDNSGRNDFWKLPDNVLVSIVIARDRNNPKVAEYLNNHGWTSGGQYIEGDENDHGSYSKNEFGFNITRKGDWD